MLVVGIGALIIPTRLVEELNLASQKLCVVIAIEALLNYRYNWMGSILDSSKPYNLV